jgi:hypothetical protein
VAFDFSDTRGIYRGPFLYNGAHGMALTAGTKLGPYEILAPLGAGGVGEAYRAREVAIKVLPADLSADPSVTRRSP